MMNRAETSSKKTHVGYSLKRYKEHVRKTPILKVNFK